MKAKRFTEEMAKEDGIILNENCVQAKLVDDIEALDKRLKKLENLNKKEIKN